MDETIRKVFCRRIIATIYSLVRWKTSTFKQNFCGEKMCDFAFYLQYIQIINLRLITFDVPLRSQTVVLLNCLGHQTAPSVNQIKTPYGNYK